MQAKSHKQSPLETVNVSKKQFAKRWGVSVRTVEQWLFEKRIPYFRITRRMIRIPVEEADRALQTFKVEAAN